MPPLALLVLCCVTSWSKAAPPSAAQEEGDLRASVVFNQLALAEVLESLKNISEGELTTSTHLDQLSQRQGNQLRDLAQGLADVNSSVESLSRTLTSHLQLDSFLQQDRLATVKLMETLKAQEKTLQDLDQECNRTTAMIQQLEAEVAEQRHETDSYKGVVLQLEEAIRAANRTVQQLGHEKRELWAKANGTEGQVDALRSRIEVLKKQERPEEVLARKEEAKRSLEQEVAALGDAKGRIQQEVARLREESDQVRQRLHAAEAQRDELQRQSTLLRNSKAQSIAEKSSSRDSIIQLQQRIIQLEAEIKQIAKQRQQSDQEKIDKQKHILSLEKLQMCTNLTEVLRQRIDSQESEIRDRQRANGALKEKHNEMQQRLLQTRTEKYELQERRFGLQAEDAQLQYEKAEVKIENLEAKVVLRRVEEEKARLETELSVLEQGRSSEREKIENLEALMNALTQQITSITSATNSLRQTKDTLSEQKDALLRDVDETEADIGRLREGKKSLQEDNAGIQLEIQDMKTTKTELEENIDDLNGQKSVLQASLQQSLNAKNAVVKKFNAILAEVKQFRYIVEHSGCK